MGLCSISPGNKWKAAAADEGEGGGAAQGGGGGTEGVTANPPSTGDIQSPEFRIASLPLILLPPPSFPFRPEPIVGLGAKHFYSLFLASPSWPKHPSRNPFNPPPAHPPRLPIKAIHCHMMKFPSFPALMPLIDRISIKTIPRIDFLFLPPSLPPSHPPLPICRSQSEAATCSGRLIGGCRDWEMRDVTIHRHPPPHRDWTPARDVTPPRKLTWRRQRHLSPPPTITSALINMQIWQRAT